MKLYPICIGLLFLLLIGCAPQAPPSTQESPLPETSVSACATKECFIASANNCDADGLTLTEDAGTFTYVSKGCVFTKTLVRTEGTPEIKGLLEGKSLTCAYEKGSFDARWVNSLVYGVELCEGELKDAIVGLLLFA